MARITALAFVWLLSGCLSPQADTGPGTAADTAPLDRSASEPVRVPAEVLDPEEARAREQIALDIADQPPELKQRYYSARLSQLDRAIELANARLEELASPKARRRLGADKLRDSLASTEARHAALTGQRVQVMAELGKVGGPLSQNGPGN